MATPAVYTVIARIRASPAAAGDTVMRHVFSSSLPPREIAARLGRIIEEELAEPATASSARSNVGDAKSIRAPGLY